MSQEGFWKSNFDKKKSWLPVFFSTSVKWVKNYTKSHFKTYLSFKKICPHFLWPNWQLNSSVVRGLQVPNSSSRIQFIKSRHRSLTNLHTRVSTYTCHYLPRYNDKNFNICVPFQRFWFGVSSTRCIKSFLWSWKWILW